MLQITIDSIILMYYVIMLYSLAFIFFSHTTYIKYKNNAKIVTIVRGVPGIGKDSYVDYIENTKNDMEVFSICNDDMYFIQENKDFSIRRLNDARKYTLEIFLEYINQGVSRIYITNINHSSEEYENYIKLARLHNYTINIVSIDCYNEEYLKYFASRSKHAISNKHLDTIYNNWEEDSRETKIDPYIPSFPGDSLPKIKTNECNLDEYFTKIDDSFKRTEESAEEESSEEESAGEESEEEESSGEESEEEESSGEESDNISTAAVICNTKHIFEEFNNDTILTCNMCTKCNTTLQLMENNYNNEIICDICDSIYKKNVHMWHCTFCDNFDICNECYIKQDIKYKLHSLQNTLIKYKTTHLQLHI